MTQPPSSKPRDWTSEDVLRALKRASEKARQLAEQTGITFVVRNSTTGDVREGRLDMKKRFTSKDDQDIPEYTREQLGTGVRGKHHKQFVQGGNVVVLQPEIQKAFPTSEKAPVSHLKDSDLQKAPQALMRAAEKARQLAEQTGTPFVSRKSSAVAGKLSDDFPDEITDDDLGTDVPRREMDW